MLLLSGSSPQSYQHWWVGASASHIPSIPRRFCDAKSLSPQRCLLPRIHSTMSRSCVGFEAGYFGPVCLRKGHQHVQEMSDFGIIEPAIQSHSDESKIWSPPRNTSADGPSYRSSFPKTFHLLSHHYRTLSLICSQLQQLRGRSPRRR